MKKQGLPHGIAHWRDGYRVRITADGKQWYIGTYTTLTDAKAALAIANSEKARGIFVPPSHKRQARKELQAQEARDAVTVDQLFSRWIDHLTTNNRAVGTISSYSSLYTTHIQKTLGDKLVGEVSEDDIDDLVASWRSTPSRINPSASGNGFWINAVSALKGLFTFAVKKRIGGITTSPVKVVLPEASKSVRVDNGTEHVATPQEVDALAKAMPKDMALTVYFAAWCSMRMGEVLGLQRQDFLDLDSDYPRVRIQRQWNSKHKPSTYTEPKDGSARVETIPQFMVPMITEHLTAHVGKTPTSPMFPSPRDSRNPMTHSRLDSMWRTRRDKILPGFKFHDLRHTGLTTYAQTGATIQEIMDRGGHKSVEVAMRYQHTARERDKALTRQMNEIINASRS